MSNIAKEQRRHRILVVDDEPLFVDTICEFLETLPGFEVARAANGQAAVDAVQRDPFDAVLLDINMPVMNGLDALKHIRAFNASVPVLMITGSDSASAAAGLAAGAYGYLPKPMDLRYIQHLVGVAVGAEFARA